MAGEDDSLSDISCTFEHLNAVPGPKTLMLYAGEEHGIFFLNRYLPPGEGFIWVAAETSIAWSIYRHMTETLGHPKAWIKAAGYWSAGMSDGGERIE